MKQEGKCSFSKDLFSQGLAFYALLLNKYEVAFGFIIDDYLYWPSSLPSDDFVGCILTSSRAHESMDHVVKVDMFFNLIYWTVYLIFLLLFSFLLSEAKCFAAVQDNEQRL